MHLQIIIHEVKEKAPKSGTSFQLHSLFNRWYVLGFVLLPILFYLPKFFEIRTVAVVRSHNITIGKQQKGQFLELSFPNVCHYF